MTDRAAPRLWYQSLGRAEAWGGYPAHLHRMLARRVRPGTVLQVAGTEQGTGVHRAAVADRAKAEVIANLRRAEAWGADAFVIGNFFDIGLAECRAGTAIAVLGLGEATLQAARRSGGSVGMLCPSAEYADRLYTALRDHGVTAADLHFGHLDIEPITRLGACFDDADLCRDAVARIETLCAAAFADCTAIVPAGGVVMALCDRAGMDRTAGGIPLLDGIAATLARAEDAMRLRPCGRPER